jgi:hypothetical protein
MNKKELLVLTSGAAVLLAVSCARLGEDTKIWDNPFDPHGVNWHPPAVQAPNDTDVAMRDTVFLRAAGQDENGVVINFLWSFDRGETWPVSGTPDQPARYFWEPSQVGQRIVWVKARDNDGVMSPPDSVAVFVHEYRPAIQRMNDTIVSQRATVNATVTANDTNGAIVKILLEDRSGWPMDRQHHGTAVWHFAPPGGRDDRCLRRERS